MHTSADDNRDDDDESNTDVLTLHATHVFVFTSAGRPLYTYRGDDNALASFMAMLRVLMSMSAAVVNAPPLPRPAAAAEQLQQQHDTTAASTPFARMTLRRVRCADARLAVHFCSEGELCYVLATRNAHSSSSSSSSNSDDAWCDALLRAVRHYVRGVVPTVDAILTQTPSYDVRSLFTRADGSVLTALIDSYTHDEDNNNNKDSVHVMRGAPLHAVAILPLRAAQRRWLQTHVLQQQQACTSSSSSGGGGGNGAYDEHHVYSCLCLRGRVLAAVARHNNNNSNTACLSASDIQLLLHFAVVLCRRQAGEAWAPLCLPDYNASGYVWVYCSTLAALTTTTTAAAAPGAAASASHSISEAVLVHVSASEHCFLHYSQYAHDAARRVLASAPLCCDVAYAHTAVADDDDDGGDNSPDASAAHRLLAWLQVNAVSRAVSHNATLLSSSSSSAISHDVVSLVNVCCEAVCWVGAVTYARATRATSGNEGDGSAAAAAAARRLCLLYSSDGALRTLLSGGGGNRRCAAAAAAAFYARIATLHARLDAQPMPLLLLLSSTAASDVTVTCDGNSNSDSKKENKHDDATAAPLAPSLVLLRPTRAVLERLRCECSAAHDGSERATTTAAAAAMQLPPLSLWSSRCQARVHELIVALAPRTTQSHTCMLSAAYSVLYLLATQPDACDIAVSL